MENQVLTHCSDFTVSRSTDLGDGFKVTDLLVTAKCQGCGFENIKPLYIFSLSPSLRFYLLLLLPNLQDSKLPRQSEKKKNGLNEHRFSLFIFHKAKISWHNCVVNIARGE